MLKQLLVTAAAALLAASAYAQNLTIGQVGYGGPGCPNGSASVILSPDATAVSILFDQYSVESGGSSGKRLDRKSCNLTIPVNVPQGYSVAIFKVDYRGYNAVPPGGSARFSAEYFWAGQRGPRIDRVFRGPINDSFTLTDQLMATTLVWTPCGDSVSLRVNTAMQNQSNSRNEQALSQVDSADISSGLVYHLQWRRCQ
jgi:hypothetical protein